MKTFTIAGRALVGPDFADATITITDARIASITRGADLHADIPAEGWVIPGFIDLQVNGAYGFDFTTDPGSVSAVAARLPATGVTAFLPTIITSPLENYKSLLRDMERAAKDAGGATILGAHLEGPYLNPARIGAHNPAFRRDPVLSELDSWVTTPFVKMVTLAPELPGALEVIHALRARGIVVSAGHSATTYEQAAAGFSAGIGWGTHLFNAMSPLIHREPGLVGALLASDVPCGLIVDGVHVHPGAVKAAYRAKGAHGITLVSDCMAAMGMGAGKYNLGDRDVIVDETSARLVDGTLAGSILRMDEAVRNLISFTGCSLADAVTMASTTPARVLGSNRKGKIETGYDADLVVLDEKLCVQMTIARGEIVCHSP